MAPCEYSKQVVDLNNLYHLVSFGHPRFVALFYLLEIECVRMCLRERERGEYKKQKMFEFLALHSVRYDNCYAAFLLNCQDFFSGEMCLFATLRNINNSFDKVQKETR